MVWVVIAYKREKESPRKAVSQCEVIVKKTYILNITKW